jgi:hypothetical protein
MATIIPDDVKPGGLITAAFFVQVLNTLREHGARLSALEEAVPPTGAVVITAVVPSGPMHLGDELRLVGRNFGIPALNNVNINGTPVTGFKAGSGDTLLIFNIPAVQGVPAQGQTATLNLSNPNGFTTTTIFLLPGQATIPSGQLFVAMSQPPQAVIAAGQDFVFGFTVTGNTNLDETYTISPRVDAGWPAILVDANNAAITPSEISIPQGNPPQGVNATFRVKVTVPQGTANNATGQLNVGIAAKRNPTGLSATSQNVAVTVGTTVGPAQNAVIITLTNVFGPGGRQGQAVTVPSNAQVRVDFSAMIKDAGSYVTSQASFANPTGWSAQLINPPNFSTTAANQNVSPLTFVLSAAQGAQQTTMTVRITAQGNPAVTGQLLQSLIPV